MQVCGEILKQKDNIYILFPHYRREFVSACVQKVAVYCDVPDGATVGG